MRTHGSFIAFLLLQGCGSAAGAPDAGDAALSDTSIVEEAGDAGVPSADGSSGLKILAFQGSTPPALDATYSAVAASGVLTGPVIMVSWNAIDNGKTLDFSSLDGPSSPLQTYLTQYPTEKVSIAFAPASDVLNNSATPADVLASAGQQICFCSGYNGDTTTVNGCFANGKWDGTTEDFTGLPVPFTGTFAARWQGFIGQVIAHLNAASYRASILYVTFGVSNGGEDIARCSGPETTLVNPATTAGLSTAWIANLDAQDSAIEAAKPTFPVVVGTSCFGVSEPPDGSTTTDDCALFADLEAQTNAKHGVGLRITTLQNGDLLAYAANTPTVSDWAANTALYPNVPIVWQTASESAPVSGSDARCNRTGSLAALVPFIMQHSSGATPLRALEAYYGDLEGTYVGASGYHDSCWPTGTVTQDPYASYDTVFKNAVAGN